MAAILGFQQRLFSKFRITTNGGQCISCGNCSTYCEMGIDVRAYAQKGENILFILPEHLNDAIEHQRRRSVGAVLSRVALAGLVGLVESLLHFADRPS